MKQKNKAYVYALLAVFFWSTVSSAFKISLRFLSEIELLFYSSFCSALVLFIILAVQKKLPLLKELKKGDLLLSALLGFLNPFLYYIVLFKAYSLLPAQQAQPLNMIWGIVLVLISIPLLKQKIKLTDLLALFICFAGVIVISTKGDLSRMHIGNLPGVLLAVGSSVVWSFYWILNIKDKKDPMLRLFLNFSAGFVFVSVLFVSIFKIPAWQGLLGGIYVGIFEMGITFFFWITALKLADKTVNVAILIYFVPFLGFVFINIFVGEKILISSVLGALLIVMGTFINKYKELKGKR